jgi:hypothetical protein
MPDVRMAKQPRIPVVHGSQHLTFGDDPLAWGFMLASGTLASRPVASVIYTYVRYYATDTAIEYFCNGVSWQPISVPLIASASVSAVAAAELNAATSYLPLTGGSVNVVAIGNYATIPSATGTISSVPPASASVQSALGNASIGTAFHNSLTYDVWHTIYLAVTANTSLVVQDGVGTTVTPVQTTIITGTLATGIVPIRVKIPANYYRLLSVSGTATDAIVGQYLEAA